MPYIPQSNRQGLDSLIDALAKEIDKQCREYQTEAAFAGILNYVYTRLALRVIKLQFGSIRYWIVATMTGVFKNASDEFYRRAAVPYEELQIQKNGDVTEYAEYEEDLEP